MRTITYHLLTNQVTESDSVYPNAFSADDNTTQLVFDYTGTACATWDKWLDLTMSDYTKDVQHLGTGAIVSFNLGAEHTKKGLLQVNPYAKNGTDKHGFPIYKLTIERQLNNSTVDASAQQSMIDHFDARLSVKADKLFATNLVTNGDFSNGTTGWSALNAGISVASNVLTMLATAQNGMVSQTVTTVSGRKYYFRTTFKANSNLVYFVHFNPTVTYYHTGSGNFESYSGVFTSVGTDTVFRIVDSRASGWANVEMKYGMLIDLTAIFGAGKEPSKEQMDNLLSTFTNSWFNGTAELVSIANLAQLKADKTQEAWITPTLLNSATGTLKYRKTSTNRLEFMGSVNAGAVDIALLPTGYRVATAKTITVGNDANAIRALAISTTGYLTLGGSGNFRFDGLSVPLD